MYEEGNIIYFDPFYFKGGGQNPKYFLVLKNIHGKTVLVTLPSSQAHLPSSLYGTHGCIDDPLSGISCYIFLKDRVITTNGFSFPLETYLHGHWIDEYDLKQLEETYTIEGIEYQIIGKLVDEEFTAIVNCFKNSKVVKNKYRRLL